MKESLTERWTSWWEMSSSASHGMTALPLSFVQMTVRDELQKDGVRVPARRSCEDLLCNDLEALTQRMCPVGHRNQTLVTLLHVLNLEWQPSLDYVEELAEHEDLPCPDPQTTNLELMHLEMAGLRPEPRQT